jgi:tRNA (uracil-5-)-methyltransferase TRM9
MREKKAQKILQSVKDTYNAIAEDFSNTRKGYSKDFSEFLEYIDENDFVLDVGCGNGRLASFLKDRLPKAKYLGLDNNEQFLKIAKNNNPGSHFIFGDQLELPIDNETADILFNIRSFHHLPSKKMRLNSLKEMKRVLKKGGIIIITVWNIWQKKYLLQIFSSFLRFIFTLGSYDYNDTFIRWGKNHKRYYHAFTINELSNIVKMSGFKIIKTEKLGHDYLLIAEK